MIYKENYIYAGKILKAHGYKGEFLVFLEGNSKDYFNKTGHVFLEIDGIQVPFFIEDISFHSSNKYVIRLEDINSDVDAEEYTGCNLFIIQKHLKKADNKINRLSLDGYLLKDLTSGKQGVVKETVEIPGNTLLKVVLSNKEEVLIPFNDKLVLIINNKEKTIEMELPEGLMLL